MCDYEWYCKWVSGKTPKAHQCEVGQEANNSGCVVPQSHSEKG